MINRNSRAASNLAMLEFVATKLGVLKDDFVFLGGCATALLITDLAAPDIRPTLDVDCVVDVLSLSGYYKLEKKLIKQGFKKSLNDDVICRWYYEDAILDVMPSDEKILGFGNPWYKLAIKHATKHELSSETSINVVSAPYFLATKIEAFKTRGNQDFLASHDFEDIITIIDGRVELVEEIKASDLSLREHINKTFSDLLINPHCISALPGHLNYETTTKGRTEILLGRLKQLANI